MTKSAHVKSDNAAIEQAMAGETWRHNAAILRRYAKRAENGEMWSVEEFDQILGLVSGIHRSMLARMWQILNRHKIVGS